MTASRLAIAACSSGGGKTTAFLGLLRAFSRRGLDVRPFKAGPDYIDAALHSVVAGKPSRNLDAFQMGERGVRDCVARGSKGSALALVEGVMGYYDGGPRSTRALCGSIGAEAILLLDARAAAESAAATALGFARFAADSRIAGCIVNRVASESHYRSVAREVERAAGLPCLGFLPEDRRCGLGERHLGLEFAPGNLEAEARIVAVADAIADSLEAHVDLDALLAIASRAPGLDEPEAPPAAATRTRIAVSRDEAFWFLYEDNLDTLRSLGAELAFFSPLRDRALPEDCSALYLCGGFPELYGDAIEANSPLRDAIRAQAARGMPVFAECGGYMYLLEGFDAPGGTAFSGCGVFAGRARFPGGLSALGYRTARLRRDGPLGRAGSELKGHVFHYSTASGDGALETRSPDSTRIALEGSCAANAFGSFLHVHFAGNPDAARAFVDAAVAFDGA